MASTEQKPQPRADRFQAAVVDEIRNGKGHIVVNAVAGSGKTTLLTMVAKALEAVKLYCLFIAFNRSIANELGERIPKRERGFGMNMANTIHGVGLAALRKAFRVWGNNDYVNNSKTTLMVREMLEELAATETIGGKHVPHNIADMALVSSPNAFLKKAYDIQRGYLLDPQDHDGLVEKLDHHSVEYHDWQIELAKYAIPYLEGMGRRRANWIVDYTDMIYLPVVDDEVRPNIFRNDLVCVDECQDLSPARLKLSMLACKPNGRMIFVGDPKQACYGFSGADCKSVETIIDLTKATVMPLSCCYRCPTSHLDMARELVPQIEARQNAPRGDVHTIGVDDVEKHVQVGDLIICRVNAPIVTLAYSLLRKRIPVRIIGRDLGKSMVAIVDRVARLDGYSFDEFGYYLSQHAAHEINAILRRNGGDNEDSRIQMLQDKIECVRELSAADDVNSTQALRDLIESLFSTSNKEEEKDGKRKDIIRLSSIHRAKGLEANRVFFMRPDLIPHPMCKQDWEIEQEYNLLYVALTRAKQTLFFVHEQSPSTMEEMPESDAQEVSEVVSEDIDDTEADIAEYLATQFLAEIFGEDIDGQPSVMQEEVDAITHVLENLHNFIPDEAYIDEE